MIVTKDLLALLDSARMDRDWGAESACATGEEKPSLWGGEVPAEAKAAKAICVTCPARAECLRYSLDTAAPYGILGGFDTRERLDLARKLADLNGPRP